MPKLISRKTEPFVPIVPKIKPRVPQQVQEVVDYVSDANKDERDIKFINRPVSWEKTVSTGSLLLDLACSGGRIEGGGIPGGIIIEIYGPSGTGKTAIVSEICASTQARGGQVRFLDPEARLDKEYSQIYGISLAQKFFDYHRPDLVEEMFEKYILPWEPTDHLKINTLAADSLAALSTELEMGEKGDKMGMKRGKEFSGGLRKTCRLIANKGWLLACTNQVREGDKGEFTPGGKGVPFYASIRIRVGYPKKGTKVQIIKNTTINLEGKNKAIEKAIGINSLCTITKNTVDDPFRQAPISIVFGYGLDDIRSNLQFNKSITGEGTYNAINANYQTMNDAISFIEREQLQEELRKRTMEIWYKVEQRFKDQTRREPKHRT